MFFFHQNLNARHHHYLLHGHLRHHIKCGKVRIGKVFFVLAHLDGIQPLVHAAEGGEVWDAAVQQGEMDTVGGNKQGTSATRNKKAFTSQSVQTTCT